jgi:HMG (high mobility group) box
MCYTDAKKKEILGSATNAKEKEETLKTVAAEWRLLSDRDRAYWDEVARNDKVRYVAR